MLRGKKIIIGISGGIAAYKVPTLIRLLVKDGAEVKVVTTENALEFVTPTTLRTLSNNTIYYNQFPESFELSTEHISITDWADLMVIAPATANIIAKFVNGIGDDALSTSFLAFNKDVIIAPSMNTKMFESPYFQDNLSNLISNGVRMISPSTGNLACGYDGKGRMEEPEIIHEYIRDYFNKPKPLEGKKVVITAGPTYEPIDSVRFIGNYSSGRMGFAIAEEVANNGGEVVLITGPSSLKTNNNRIQRININTAEEMYIETNKHFPQSDVAILSAAVADYRPSTTYNTKLKKSDGLLNIELSPTKDILASLGKVKTKEQILVGFALETDNEVENAKKKLFSKNLDFIVLNSLRDEGAGFSTPTNKVSIIDNSSIQEFPLKSKQEVAKDIIKKLISLL